MRRNIVDKAIHDAKQAEEKPVRATQSKLRAWMR